ncbi:SusC/RagA family TonB-linked outer membrane protein [Sphingobacterium tabacisoli]|uniref:SusC/RagA family TonB-linked outer membrane protein n=1 Tax=Sphingobacterium tabacisoli TaxID=2044855 RepID=A0ABW5L1L1_9SPHI|nr:SusC/RagA family TonB-linked outer membrane protein [Sphingobacterium tabacisoli]
MRHLLKLLFILFPLWASAQQIVGSVADQEGIPLMRITVKNISTGQMSITDDRGRFLIKGVHRSAILRFTGTGYEAQEVLVNELRDIRVVLKKAVSVLDEVQVIGYGTTTQRYNVGSVTTVRAEDIADQPISNPLAALQGRVPGLVVANTSGLPGAAFTVQVRGQNSLRANIQEQGVPLDNPLFIIDGVPFAPQNNNLNLFRSIATQGIGSGNTNSGGISPFNGINPADIESIEVLRDADATAIYGARGGNGVILITTKRGGNEEGKTSFVMDAVSGVSVIGKTMRMMNTKEYLAMRSEALENENLSPNLTILDEGYAPDLLLFDQNRYTDWKDYFMGNTAHNTIVNMSLSGGARTTNFRIGAGFNRNTFIFPGDYSDNRGSLSWNLNHSSIDQKFHVNMSALYAYNKNNSSGTPDLLSAYRLPPNFPEFIDAEGKLLWEYKGVPFGVGSTDNPLSYLRNQYSISNTTLNSNLMMSYEILKGLVFKTSLGYNSVDGKEYKGVPRAAKNPVFGTTATASFGTNEWETWIVEPQLTYYTAIGKSNLDFLAGATLQRQRNGRVEMSGSGYSNDDLIESISAAAVRNVTDGSSQYSYAAAFGRMNYRWGNKYIANVSIRRDGSSRFGPGKQYGTFGALGVGWLLTEERFLKDMLSFLSFGKLRGSYGVTGSDAIGDYLYLPRWASSTYPYDGETGYLPQNLYNPKLHWATTKKMEVGLDLAFLQDRILMNTSYYNNRSGNQLITYSIPAIAGFNTVPQNWNATVENKGLEVAITSKNIETGGLKWTTSFNITFPKNKLVSFPGIESSSYNTRYVVGKSVNTVLGFDYVGVNSTSGLFEFRKEDGAVSSAPEMPSYGRLNDYVAFGSLDPKYYGGLLNSIRYKKISLDVHFDFRKQIGANYLQQVYASMPGMAFNVPASMVDRWRQPGDVSDFQRLSTAYGEVFDTSRFFKNSSGTYGDASYIKCRHIAIGYDVGGVTQKLKIRGLRLYVAAQNLFTISNYAGNDPETQMLYGVPVLRTVTGGIQLSL